MISSSVNFLKIASPPLPPPPFWIKYHYVSMYVTFSLLTWFHVLADVYKALVNMHVPESMDMPEFLPMTLLHDSLHLCLKLQEQIHPEALRFQCFSAHFKECFLCSSGRIVVISVFKSTGFSLCLCVVLWCTHSYSFISFPFLSFVLFCFVKMGSFGW